MVVNRIPVTIADQVAAMNAAWSAMRAAAVEGRSEYDRDRIARADALRTQALRAASELPSISMPELCKAFPCAGKGSWSHILYSLVEREQLERVAGTGRPGTGARYRITPIGRQALADLSTDTNQQ